MFRICHNHDSDTKITTAYGFGVIVGFTVLKNSLDYLKGYLNWFHIYVLKKEFQGFQWFSVIGRMYLMVHPFFITRD